MNTVGVLPPSVVEAAVAVPPAGLVRKEQEAFAARSAHAVSVHVASQVKVLSDAAGGEFVLLRYEAKGGPLPSSGTCLVALADARGVGGARSCRAQSAR